MSYKLERFVAVCKIIGYRGICIDPSEIESTVEGCLERPINICKMREQEFNTMLAELAINWQNYIRTQGEIT